LAVRFQPAPISMGPTKARKSGAFSLSFSAGTKTGLDVERERLDDPNEAIFAAGESADLSHGRLLAAVSGPRPSRP
jgi:hypothetical protein